MAYYNFAPFSYPVCEKTGTTWHHTHMWMDDGAPGAVWSVILLRRRGSLAVCPGPCIDGDGETLWLCWPHSTSTTLLNVVVQACRTASRLLQHSSNLLSSQSITSGTGAHPTPQVHGSFTQLFVWTVYGKLSSASHFQQFTNTVSFPFILHAQNFCLTGIQYITRSTATGRCVVTSTGA